VLHLLGKITMLLSLLSSASLKAQDPVFAQYYLNQNYLNPAFAGYTNDLTVNFNSRAQYFRVPGLLMSNIASVNISCEDETRLGIGVLAYNHIEGEGYLSTTNLSGQLSANFPFKFKTGIRSRMNKGLIAGGVQFGLGQKHLNWDRLTFSDQFTPYASGVQGPSNVMQQQRSSNLFLDASLGVRASLEFGTGRRPKFLSLGAAVFHLNRPVQTFYESEVPLEPRYSFYLFSYFGSARGGRTKDLRYWTFGALADYQQGLQSHTISLYKDASELLTVGLSLRRQEFIFIDRNVDAVIPHVMFHLNDFNKTKDDLTISISYEWTVSTLGEEQTFGTAEIGIKWRFSGRNLCRKRMKLCKVKGFDMGHDMPNIYF
jgi:type IX secretion system PorP/SprF family membrane protein